MKALHYRIFTRVLKIIGIFAIVIPFNGCGEDPPEYVMRFYISADGKDYGRLVFKARLPISQTELDVYEQPVIMEGDIVDVQLARVEMGLGLYFQLSDISARQLYRVSVANQGRYLILFFNGVAVGARLIEGALERGQLFTFVEMKEKDIEEILPKLQESVMRVQKIKADQ